MKSQNVNIYYGKNWKMNTIMKIGRINNRKTNSHQERYLQMIYQDNNSYYLKSYLNKAILFLFIREIFSFLPLKMYKISRSLSPILIKELFMPNNEHTYSLRHLRQLKTPSVNTVYHGRGFIFRIKNLGNFTPQL